MAEYITDDVQTGSVTALLYMAIKHAGGRIIITKANLDSLKYVNTSRLVRCEPDDTKDNEKVTLICEPPFISFEMAALRWRDHESLGTDLEIRDGWHVWQPVYGKSGQVVGYTARDLREGE